MPDSKSLAYYGDSANAQRYSRTKGFAAERKERMLEVARDILVAVTAPYSTLLELGAGAGHFTEKLLQTDHFERIYVTDGTESMLDQARQRLTSDRTSLRYDLLDFTASWSSRFDGPGIDAVASSMAIHHAPNKQDVFRQIFAVLKPGGALVLADHMAGSSPRIQYLIGRERALVRLGAEGREHPERVAEVIRGDERHQEIEGDRCETVAQYQHYLAASGFSDIDCLWRDYWLAVFVAHRPEDA